MLAVSSAMTADHVREGIRVNCVSLGTVDTPWINRLLEAADDPCAERTALEARQPHGRLVEAAEVAETVAYLAEMRAESHITGTVLVQSAHDPGETLQLCAALDHERVLGAVGWVDLRRDVPEQLAQIEIAYPDTLVGIRHLAHQDPDPQVLLGEAMRPGIRELGRAGLPLGLIPRPGQLPQAIHPGRYAPAGAVRPGPPGQPAAAGPGCHGAMAQWRNGKLAWPNWPAGRTWRQRSPGSPWAPTTPPGFRPICTRSSIPLWQNSDRIGSCWVPTGRWCR